MKSPASRAIVLLIAVFILIVKKGKALPESATEDLPLLRHIIEYKAGDLKDPFQPLKKREGETREQIPKEQIRVTPLPDLVIQGIVWGGRLPQAIINNEVVKIGDTIEGVRIIDISKDGVIISFGNQQYNLLSPAVVSLEDFKEKAKDDKKGVKKE